MISEFVHKPQWRSQTGRSAGLSAVAAAVLGAIALLAAACGDGGDVRIVALTPTPVPEQTVVRGADGPATIVTATPTPGALEGTATPTPTVTATADEPPGPPDKPDEPLAGALLLRDYLASGELDLLGCLPELVAAWGTLCLVHRRSSMAGGSAEHNGLRHRSAHSALAVQSGTRRTS